MTIQNAAAAPAASATPASAAAPEAPAAAAPEAPAAAPAAAPVAEADMTPMQRAIAVMQGKIKAPVETSAQPTDSEEAQDQAGAKGAQGEAEEEEEEAATAEGEAPAAAEEEERPDPDARRFAALATREHELVRRGAELKEKEAKVHDWEKKRAAAKQNPLAALQELGVTYEQLTDFVVHQKPGAELQQSAVHDELKQLKDRQEAFERQQAERERQSYVDGFKGRVATALAKDLDAYELIHAKGEQEMVFEVIQGHAQRTGQMLGGSEEEAIRLAAEQVEDFLLEDAKRVLTTKKLGASISPVAPKRAVPGPRANGPKPAAPRTLTNRHSAVVPSQKSPDDMTESERMAAATSLVRFKGP